MMTRSEKMRNILWNLFLIITGSLLYVFGLSSLVAPHRFLPGGLFGLALFVHYLADRFQPELIFAVLNIPLFLIAFRFLTLRFVLYSLVSMITATLAYPLLVFPVVIQDPLYAAIAGGVVCGIGGGIVLRSAGSNGGLDILSVIFFQYFNIGIGKFFFLFNCVMYSAGLFFFNLDTIIVSLIFMFVTSVSMEYALAMFNQRKLVLIISDENTEIAAKILNRLKIGSTYLQGVGAYTNRTKHVLMTVINNIQLKRLEEIVFSTDENALFIVENTFSVIGSSFSKRKLY